MREPKKFGKRMSHGLKELENVAKKATTKNRSNPYDPIFGLKRNDKVIFHIRWRCNICDETITCMPTNRICRVYFQNKVFKEEALCPICKIGILKEESYYVV